MCKRRISNKGRILLIFSCFVTVNEHSGTLIHTVCFVKIRCRYALSLNTIKDKHMHSSAMGAGVETGSTVESDLNTNATSLLDLLGNRNNEDIKDIQERETFSNTEEGQESGQRTTGASFIPDLKPTTQNAYGGGIYGTEEVPSPRRAARASNSQSADGPISETPAHKDVKMHLSGDRGQDITGQSYIQ